MTVSRVWIAAALVASMAGGCRIDADYGDGMFSCTEACQEGFSCVGGQCVVSVDGGVGVDAAACLCEAAVVADDCGLNVVDLGGAGAGGELFCASTEANTDAVTGCTNEPMPGRDAAFRVTAAAGQTLTATVVPTDFDVAVYITRDCSGVCNAFSNNAAAGVAETVTLTTDVGDYFVVVDSPNGMGCYELTVTLE